jgi:hypothetical protein
MYDINEFVQNDTNIQDLDDVRGWAGVAKQVSEIMKDMKPADADGLMPNVIINLTKE